MSDGAGRYPASTMRASDADRDGVLAELSENFQAGRLTSDELQERTGLALQARTFRDLAALTADLPSPAAPMKDPAGGLPLGPGPAGGPPIRLGLPGRPVLVPVAVGLVAVIVVVGALVGPDLGLRGAHLLWLVLIVPIVARRMAGHRRR